MRRKKYENVLKINKRCIKNKKVKYMDVNHLIKFIKFMLEFIKKSRFILNHKKNKWKMSIVYKIFLQKL